MGLQYPQCIACDVIMYILSLLYWCFIQWYRSHISIILIMSSETLRIYAMFWFKFTPRVEKCYHSSANSAILTNIWLKKCRRSNGVNCNTSKIGGFCFSYPLKYVFFNLVNPLMWNIKKPSVNTNFAQIWQIRINKNMYDQC